MGVPSSNGLRGRELRIALWLARSLRSLRALEWSSARSRVAFAIAVAAIGLLSASRVLAHATPHVLDIAFRDSGYVLLSNRGLIFGDKDRSNWRLMCAEALGINTTEVPSLVGLPDGRLMVSTSRGLTTTDDDGCTWQPVAPFGMTSVPALVADPTEPKRIYLAAYTADPEMADLGGVYVSEDGATNWTKLLAANDHDYVRSIRVAKSDPKHIYATGQTWDMLGKYTYYLTQSRDSGKTWERQVIPLEMDELDLQLFAVSPTDPQVIAVRAGGANPMMVPERLLISKDGGKTFTSPFKMLLLSELAFSADGAKAWVVGQDGFFESTDGFATFNRVGVAESMSYVTEREGEVLACGYYAGIGMGVNGIGTSKMVDTGFASFMQLNDVRAQVQCDAASSTAMKCASWWVDWERELMAGQFSSSDGGVVAGSGGSAGSSAGSGGGSTLDAGVAGSAGSQPSAAGAAGSALDGGAKPSSSDDGGCTVVAVGGRSRGASFAFVAGGLAIAWLRRRKSRVARRA